MKNLLKNKKVIIIASAVLAVLLIAGTVFCLTRPENEPKQDGSEPTISDTEKDVVVDLPDNSDTSGTDSESVAGEIEDDGNALTPDESIEPSENKNTGTAAEKDNTPATEAEPPKAAEPENNGDGIQIGGSENDENYSCGCANHHCKTAENHAYVLNLELEGCPYCGSYSCPSFYAVNEWGYPRCDPSKCPQYNAQKDLIHYCQVCGKPVGSGQNGTCTQYINACECPFCGEHVESFTCHTCK